MSEHIKCVVVFNRTKKFIVLTCFMFHIRKACLTKCSIIFKTEHDLKHNLEKNRAMLAP